MFEKIEGRLIGKTYHIDLAFGLSLLENHLSNIQLIESTASLKEVYPDKMREVLNAFSFFSNGEIKDAMNTDPATLQKNSIVKVNLHGGMYLEDGLCSYGIRSMADKMMELDGNKNVSGFIIDTHSGGGESEAGHYMNSTVKELSKPVVAMVTLAASAAYNAVLPAKQIIARADSSMVGSIGSYFSVNKKMLQYIKDNYLDIYSNKSPQKNKAMRAFMEDDNSLLMEALDKSVEQFHNNVIKYRKELNKELKKDTLEGGIFYAKDAKTRGLIDQIGGYNLAIKTLKSYI